MNFKRFGFVCLILFICSCAYPLRIISTAPSITESVYLVGGQKYLIAVTRYCDYPIAAQQKPKIGGYFDFNQEQILLLNPDIVLLLKGNNRLKQFLQIHGVAFKEFDNESISGITSMIEDIGILIGDPEAGKVAREKIETDMSFRSKKLLSRQKIKTIIIVDQVIKGGRLSSVYIVGKDKVYSELMDLVGFENAYVGSQQYPNLSVEALYFLHPKLIVVLGEKKVDIFENAPKSFKDNLNIVYLPQKVMKRPGPRLPEILSRLAEIQNQVASNK